MSIVYRDSDHTYWNGAREVPGVTTVLKSAAVSDDYSAVPEDVLERARERGVAVHAAIDLSAADLLNHADLPFEAMGYLDGWIKFLTDTKFVVHDTEKLVYHPLYGYAGRGDLFGSFPKAGNATIDVKATYAIPHSVGPQTAAYDAAYWKPTDKSKRYCLQLKSDGTYKLEPQTDPTDLRVFLAALTIHNWKRSLK